MQLLLGWCSSCSVGALLALASGKAERRQVYPLSVPPFAFAVRSVSVRRPIGFRPPSDWIPSAVRLDSVCRPIGFRPPSVEKCWEKRCKNVVLNGKTIGDFAIFDVSVFLCFYYPHPNHLCRSVKSVGEYSAVNSVSSAYSVGKNSAVNFVHSAYSVGEYSAVNSVSSAYSVGKNSAVNFVHSAYSVGEYSAVNSVSSAYSVGKNSAVNFVHSVKSAGEYSVINSVSSAYSVGDHSVKPSMKSCFFVQFRRLLEKNAI